MERFLSMHLLQCFPLGSELKNILKSICYIYEFFKYKIQKNLMQSIKFFEVKMLNVKIKKSADAKTPFYAHKGDSGVDLYSAEEHLLKPMERKLIATGIKIALPYGYEAQIRPKSGLAIEHGISHANCIGTIDSCYRGEIKVPMINFGDKPYKIEKGKKIAQMVFAKVEIAIFEEVDVLEETTRNEKGFGSTGLD